MCRRPRGNANNEAVSFDTTLTKKLPEMRDWDHANPSVHRLIPLSSTLNTKTAPLRIMDLRSSSFNRLVTRGKTPWRAAFILEEYHERHDEKTVSREALCVLYSGVFHDAHLDEAQSVLGCVHIPMKRLDIRSRSHSSSR